MVSYCRDDDALFSNTLAIYRDAGGMKSDILKRFDLTGKVVAITGGGGELCGAMAEALGATGVKVAILDINLESAEARSLTVIQSGGTA